MKVFARILGEWLAIPCLDNWKISDVKVAILDKRRRLLNADASEDEDLQLRKTSNMALLDPEDHVHAVLKDEDYVSVGKFYCGRHFVFY